ncbi:MAG: glutamine--fructose-6-phosphate transaminase (isomerizing) [bacterium]
MCGIVGAVGADDVLPLLLDGLRRLEYRGYDSAGVAVIDAGRLTRIRSVGRVADLERAIGDGAALGGATGIAHTRWATHGPATEANAHPHTGDETLALVCNGIIENHETLRREQQADGFEFASQTDTEVVVNEVRRHLRDGSDLLAAVQATLTVLEGAYAIGVVSAHEPRRLIGARHGSPLVVGIGDGAAYIASDMAALVSVTRDFQVLENGDVVDINDGAIAILDHRGRAQQRPRRTCSLSADAIELGDYRHYMLKEIHEQGVAIANALEGRIAGARLLEQCFGVDAASIFDRTRAVRILACGTSYHAGLVASYWFERYGVPCRAEIASEFRSRAHAVEDDCLVVTLSQSGETIDTLSALEVARAQGFERSLTICNSPESSLVRASDLALMTHAGAEIGVASTKAFTTQLVALRLLVIALGRRFRMTAADEARLIAELRELPAKVEKAIALEPLIADIAEQFADKQHALFLGRGAHYPIALEGALKLKEISYIHAEAYPAGELKHGPLALVDADMPVISVAPNDRLIAKLKANIEEVRARGGKLIVFADPESNITAQDNLQVINIAPVDSSMAPIIYTIPLQLLAYHVALIKGTDVDKPRNLAKSVTVE